MSNTRLPFKHIPSHQKGLCAQNVSSILGAFQFTTGYQYKKKCNFLPIINTKLLTTCINYISVYIFFLLTLLHINCYVQQHLTIDCFAPKGPMKKNIQSRLMDGAFVPSIQTDVVEVFSRRDHVSLTAICTALKCASGRKRI